MKTGAVKGNGLREQPSVRFAVGNREPCSKHEDERDRVRLTPVPGARPRAGRRQHVVDCVSPRADGAVVRDNQVGLQLGCLGTG